VLNQWLQAAQRSSGGFTRFGVTDVTELGAPPDAVKDHLYELLQVSAVDPGFLGDLANRLGWEKTRAIVSQRLPSNSSARRGRFGEVVGVNMLHQFDGYVIPIEKAHFSITGGQSQPSARAGRRDVPTGLARQRAGKQPPVQRRGTRSRAGQTRG
jgi:hypothetical protein